MSKNPVTEEIANITVGNFNQQIGEFDKALENFKIVNKINPLNTLADKSISTMHKYTNKDDPHLLSMKKLPNIKFENDLQSLYFALGKAYEDLDDHKESFKFLKLGNDIADKNNYDFKDDENLFLAIKKSFKTFDKNKVLNSDTKIIFIVGMPRSGTTLAEQIISAHKNVYGAGELSYLSDAIEKTYNYGEEISKNIQPKIADKFSRISNLDDEILKNLQSDYLLNLKSHDYETHHITDKAPLNFRWIGIIKYIFPKAKIIHCNRNAMDICYSNYKNAFSSNSLAFTYNLKNLGLFFNLYKDLMNFWKNTFGDQIYDLTYENLINNKEEEVQKLLKFCELEWDSNCLSPHKNKKAVATASLAQVRSPIYKSSIEKWKNYENELSELRKIIEIV